MLIQKIQDRSARLGVVGLGYVGLPLAVEFARAGFHVTGFDVSPAAVDAVNGGRSHIGDVSSEVLRELVDAGRLTATGDFTRLAELDSVNICVPTPLRKTRDPDVSYIVSAVERIAEHIHPGFLVILESTTYPGTTEELILPLLEASGLAVGKDFFLAFSPERVDPGNRSFTTRNIPKVVGGVTPACTEAAAALYSTSLETVIPVSSSRVAEMVKLIENTFRSVNIGLVNELALMCDSMGIDVWEVIEAAATKPFGFMPFFPGPGLGGHCIPIDPFYLSWKARQVGFEARFIELAGIINAFMPQHVVQKVARALNEKQKSVNGARILVMGVAYKRGIKDTRESPAIDIITHLATLGADIAYCDPHVPDITVGDLELTAKPFTPETLAAADLALIVTDHPEFDYDVLVEHAPLIVDTRNALKGRKADHIRKL